MSKINLADMHVKSYVVVHWKNGDDPTRYGFDDRESLLAFLWDCKSCLNFIESVSVKITEKYTKMSNPDIIDDVIKKHGTKSILKRLGGEYLLDNVQTKS